MPSGDLYLPLTPTADGSDAIDGLDQPAPTIALGADGQPAADAQMLIHNQWRSGDRVLFQVRDAAGENCASVPTSIGYSQTPTVVSSDTAFEFNVFTDTPWAESDFGPSSWPDLPVVSEGPQVQPEFQVNLLSSTQCAPNGISDIIEILFTNESVDPAAADYDVTDAWVLSISDIAYNVGPNATPGPLRNLPLAQNATATPGIFINTDGWYGGNLAATGADPLVQLRWTTTAFVSPFNFSAEVPGTLIADGFTQNLGTITLEESAADGFTTGVPETYQVCYSGNIGSIVDDVTASDVVDPLSVAVFGGNCITFDVEGTAGLDTVVLDNIFGEVNGAGSVFVSLVTVPIAVDTEYFQASDNSTALGVAPLSNSHASHVERLMGPYLSAPLGAATSLPDRIGGNDRFETAAKIAYSMEGCADFVVLVNGNSFPDSLSASYLAGALSLSSNNEWEGDIPILTTRGTSLAPAAELAIRELGVRTVYIIGGTAAVSADVEAAVDALPRAECGGDISDTTQTVQVERVAGADRYATNRQVVQRAQSILDSDEVDYNERIRYQANAGEPSGRTALMASGADFADAMSAGPISFGDDEYGFPLVLTRPNVLSPEAASTLANIDIDQVILVGGEAAVSADVVASLEALGIDVIRLAGANRYETAIQVLLWAATPEFPNTNPVLVGGEGFNLGIDWSIFGDVVLARGDDFADALAVAPYVASREDMLVLTTPTSLAPAAGAFISGLAGFGLNPDIVAIGLGEAISGNVLDEANALANP